MILKPFSPDMNFKLQHVCVFLVKRRKSLQKCYFVQSQIKRLHTVFLFWIVFNIIVVHKHGQSRKLWLRSAGQLTPLYLQKSLFHS